MLAPVQRYKKDCIHCSGGSLGNGSSKILHASVQGMLCGMRGREWTTTTSTTTTTPTTELGSLLRLAPLWRHRCAQSNKPGKISLSHLPRFVKSDTRRTLCITLVTMHFVCMCECACVRVWVCARAQCVAGKDRRTLLSSNTVHLVSPAAHRDLCVAGARPSGEPGGRRHLYKQRCI